MDPNEQGSQDDEQGSQEDREIDRLRVEAYRLLLQQADKAAEQGQMRRFDELLERLAPRAGAGLAAAVEDQEDRRERRMDIWRMTMAGLLVAGLISIIIYAVWAETDVADQFVPLVSGLAGIAIGWLYGSSGRRRALEVES